MGRTVKCPVCGKIQVNVDLEKSNGMFECDNCLVQCGVIEKIIVRRKIISRPINIISNTKRAV